jgi:hypothetical protein
MFAHGLVAIASVAVRVTAALAKVFNNPLTIDSRLPHIRLPVGDQDDSNVSIEGMIDTGAGLNIGRLAYHSAVWKMRPDIVEQFAYIDDVANAERFGIGGIGANGAQVDCVALITYKLPYRINGRPVRLTLALTEDAAANTILSCPFLKNSGCAIVFPNDEVVVTAFGETFEITYAVPSCDDAPPPLGQEVPSAFPVRPAHTEDSLSDLLDRGIRVSPAGNAEVPVDLSTATVAHATTLLPFPSQQ